MKKTTPRKRVLRVAVTPEERYHMINDAAYFRALKHRQAGGDAAEDAADSWYEVQAEIDAVLKYQDNA